MKVLITGGAGYIGSHLIKIIGEETNWEIVCADNLISGHRKLVLYGNFERIDLCNEEEVDLLFKKYKFDCVFHLAALIRVEESVNKPLIYYKNNILSTINLLKAMKRYKVKYLIFSSTAAVYGIPSYTPIDEKHSTLPINPYGRSKLFCEEIIKDFANEYKDFRYVILRYFNVAGASPDIKIGQIDEHPTHLITRALKTAKGEFEKFFIYGNDYDTKDGTCIRDFIHVYDIGYAHIYSLNYLLKGGSSEIFNCGYGMGFSVKEIINTVKKITGIDFKVEITERRKGDPPVLIANSQKLQKLTGWNPKYKNIEFIIKTHWEWEKKL